MFVCLTDCLSVNLAECVYVLFILFNNVLLICILLFNCVLDYPFYSFLLIYIVCHKSAMKLVVPVHGLRLLPFAKNIKNDFLLLVGNIEKILFKDTY